jgi:multiple sugar transport system substrate-binding protein
MKGEHKQMNQATRTGASGRGRVRRRGTQACAVLTAAAALGLGGMMTAPSALAATTSAKTTIEWWASPISTSGPDLRKTLIAAFEKAYPNITVSLQTAPTNTDTNEADLETTISGGSAKPDVFMGDVIWPGTFGAHGFAVPLSKYLPSSFFMQFAPGLAAGASYKGQVYGAPFFQDQGFLYYRKDLLTAAHMAVPKTWEQLESDAASLVKMGKVKYGFVWEGDSYEGGTCDFMEYYADTGGQVLNSSDTASVLNVADVTKVLTFMRGLVTSGASPAAVDTFQEPQANTAFDDGQAAFLRNWDYAYGTANTKGSDVIGKVGVVPLPTFAGQPAPGYSNIGGWNNYINPHSKNLTADLDFIKFMSGTQAQTIEAKPPFSEIPTNQAVRSNPAIKALNAPFAILSQTKLVPRPAQTPDYAKISQAIYTNMNAALAGSASASSAANAMNSGVKSALSSSGL